MFGSTLEPSQILLITHTNGHCPSLIRSLESCLRSHQPQLTVIILKKRNTINLTLRLQLLTGWTPSVVSENVVRATDELLCHNNAESSLPPPLVTIEVMSSPGLVMSPDPGSCQQFAYFPLDTPQQAYLLPLT